MAKGSRTISLLSSLHKGLEMLMAKRMAHTAISQKVVPRQLFGAPLERFFNHHIACVIHDIDHPMHIRQKVVLVTFDVQGAFDAVLYERLLPRRRKMGWPESTADWVKYFLHARSARLHHEDRVTEPVFLECRLSQRSLLSLILLLYMTEVVGGSQCINAYADDVAIFGIGKTLLKAATAAWQEVNAVLAWATEYAVSFDPGKADVVYFLCPIAKRCGLPPITVCASQVNVSVE